MKMMMIKSYFGILSILAPRLTARKSFELFQKVRIKKIRRREEEFFKQAKKFSVENVDEAIDCFEIGDADGLLVFLVHGWDSNAGSLSKVAKKFEENGFRVIAFNLPGHAEYKASSTNLIECRNAMRAVIDFINPTEPFSVVSHSFGSAVVANALAYSEYEVDKLVYLTNPNKVEDIFGELRDILGLKRRAYKHLIKKVTKIIGGPIDLLDVDENLNRINFNKLLMIHDVNDTVLPFKNSFEINSKIKNSQLISMEKIGHYRMLWNDEVIGRTVAFVQGKEVL